MRLPIVRFSLSLFFVGLFASMPGVRAGERHAADDAVQTATASAPAATRTLTEVDCVAAKVGTTIPTASIGEPVSAVTLAAPAWTAATATTPAFCAVTGSMAPVDRAATARPINFRVVMPAAWTGRAVQLGGGGMNGTIPNLTGPIDGGPSGPARGVVTYGSDSGHQMGPGTTTDWAMNDEAIKNLGYMQMKKTHDAAMAIVERAYGSRPAFNYYVGTSQGGREALTVAQRYPADYNGIIANVPIVNFSSLMLAPELIRIQEKPVANWITRAKVEAIRGEFMRQCDTLDGLVDGVMNNYAACRAIFDVKQGAPNRHPWASKRCANNVDPNPADTSTAACLTDGQIATLELVYSRYAFATPLANGVRTFGMWVPNTDPSGSGLILEQRFIGQEGAAADARMHSHLGVLGVTGFLMRDVNANPLSYVEGGPLNGRRARAVGLARQHESGPRHVPAPRRQDDRHYRHGRHPGVSRRAARLLPIRDRPDGPLDRRRLRATVRDPAGESRSARRECHGRRPGSHHSQWARAEHVRQGRAAHGLGGEGTAPGASVTVVAGERSLPLCGYPSYPRYVSGPATAAASYRCSN